MVVTFTPDQVLWLCSAAFMGGWLVSLWSYRYARRAFRSAEIQELMSCRHRR